jgi:hypothetical protein
VETQFCRVSPNICGSSAKNLSHGTLLEPRILRWGTGFLENLCTPAFKCTRENSTITVYIRTCHWSLSWAIWNDSHPLLRSSLILSYNLHPDFKRGWFHLWFQSNLHLLTWYCNSTIYNYKSQTHTTRQAMCVQRNTGRRSLIIVAVEKPYVLRNCTRVRTWNLAYPACNSYAPYCDVIFGLSGSTIFFDIIS